MTNRQIDRLLVKISQGDNSAFGELYDETKRGVFSFIYSYLKNYEDTEDVMQNVYLKIKLNISKYVHGTNGRAWILQIAKNAAVNELYRKKPTVSLDQVSIESKQMLSDGITDVIHRVLTQDEEQIVIMHVLWGFKHREIAEQLNCPTGSITSKYKRSIEKLKTAIKEAEV